MWYIWMRMAEGMSIKGKVLDGGRAGMLHDLDVGTWPGSLFPGPEVSDVPGDGHVEDWSQSHQVGREEKRNRPDSSISLDVVKLT